MSLIYLYKIFNGTSPYNIYASAYYGEWQSPTVISSSPVWSIDPDITYAPGGMIEGRLLVFYAEGNGRWLDQGLYLPLYRVCTYQSSLPLAPGGGPQDVVAVPTDMQKPMLDVYPNPGDKVFTVKYAITYETPVNLSLIHDT